MAFLTITLGLTSTSTQCSLLYENIASFVPAGLWFLDSSIRSDLSLNIFRIWIDLIQLLERFWDRSIHVRSHEKVSEIRIVLRSYDKGSWWRKQQFYILHFTGGYDARIRKLVCSLLSMIRIHGEGWPHRLDVGLLVFWRHLGSNRKIQSSQFTDFFVYRYILKYSCSDLS